MEAETDKVTENNFLDLLEISANFGEENENQLFQWVRHLHLDDEDGNHDPKFLYKFEKQVLMLVSFN